MCDQMPSANDPIQSYNRRQFITTALAGAAILAGGPELLSAAEGKKKKKAAAKGQAAKGEATDIVTLGATGIKTTRLAQGTGWNGGDAPRPTVAWARKLLRNWFVTASTRGSLSWIPPIFTAHSRMSAQPSKASRRTSTSS